MARSPRNFDELKSSIEESMAEALQQHRQDEPESVQTVPPAETTVQPESRSEATVQPESRSNADQLVQMCNTTATEIQSTGDAVVQVANSIAAETQALAELLRKHG